MNSFAITDQSTVLPFGRSPMKQSRIPLQRHAHRTAVGQIDGQCVVSDLNTAGSRGLEFSRQSAHAMPPEIDSRSVPRAAERESIRLASNHDCFANVPAPTKTWQRNCLAPREYAAVRSDPRSKRRTDTGLRSKPSAFVVHPQDVDDRRLIQ